MTPEGLIWGLIVFIALTWAVTYAIKTPNETIEEMNTRILKELDNQNTKASNINSRSNTNFNNRNRNSRNSRSFRNRRGRN